MTDTKLLEPLELWFGPIQVGVVNVVYYDDLNWYGMIELKRHPKNDTLADRVYQFIKFCIAWRKRFETEEPDATEFDEYDW